MSVSFSDKVRESRGSVRRRPIGPRRHAAGLLAALVALLVVAPFVEVLPNGDLIEALLLTAVMVTGARAIGGRRRDLIIALLLVGPALAGRWVNYFRPDPKLFLPLSIAFLIAFGLYVVAILLRYILRATRVDSQIICAALAGFLMLGVVWAMAYMLIERISPYSFANAAPPRSGSLDPFSALYFSFITICTVGYGDIAPISRVARMLAMMEGLTGMFYTAVLISRLVALYSSESQADQGTQEKEAEASFAPKDRDEFQDEI